MIPLVALVMPECDDFAAAFAFIERERRGREIVSVALYRGPDKKVRGSVMMVAGDPS